VLFNADEWVRTAKQAGMKYLNITAKHHDGFCLWPTAVSPYNIGNSPFKRDIVQELAQACRRQGIEFCVYFTVLDWHDPDYPTKSPYDSTQDVKGDMGRFVGTMKMELKEIVTKYHPFMLWFDGNWEKYWTLEDGKDIYRYLKELDPRLIINNRIGKGSHSRSDGQTVGDFLTPEQTIGAINMKDPWESCITLCTQWAWRPNDHMKSLKECIHTLEKTAGGNGNLLLNVGPMMDGRMEARQITRLREMGIWLQKYGESIYDTHGGPYAPTADVVSTRKGNRIYVHLLEQRDRSLQLAFLPGVKVKKVYIMNGGALSFTQDEKTGYRITLPEVFPDTVSSVVVLELDKSTEALPVIN
ncbi:MAG TPA: alpha-L-fucosidase, partial [Puia sp.]